MINKPESDNTPLKSTGNIVQADTTEELLKYFRFACLSAKDDLSVLLAENEKKLQQQIEVTENCKALSADIERHPEVTHIKESVQKTRWVVEEDCWSLGYKCNNRCVHEYYQDYCVEEWQKLSKPILSENQKLTLRNLHQDYLTANDFAKQITQDIKEIKDYQKWLKNHSSNLLCLQSIFFNARAKSLLSKSPELKQLPETLQLFDESLLKDILIFYQDFKETEGVAELTSNLVTNDNLLPFLQLMKDKYGEQVVEEFLLSFLAINLRKAPNNSLIQYYILSALFSYHRFFDKHFLETVCATVLGGNPETFRGLNPNSLNSLIKIFLLSTQKDFYKNKLIWILESQQSPEKTLNTLIKYANKVGALDGLATTRESKSTQQISATHNLNNSSNIRAAKIAKKNRKHLDAKIRRGNLFVKKIEKAAHNEVKQRRAHERRIDKLSQIKTQARGNYRSISQIKFRKFFTTKNNQRVMHVSLAFPPSRKKLDLMNEKQRRVEKTIESKEIRTQLIQGLRGKEQNQKNQERNSKRQKILDEHRIRKQKNDYIKSKVLNTEKVAKYAEILETLNSAPFNKQIFKDLTVDSLQIFYQLVSKVDANLYPVISSQKFQILGNCREEAFEKLQKLVTDYDNDQDKLHLLNKARKLSLFAQHRNDGFFKTMGRTNTVIKIDNMIAEIKENQIRHTYFRH